MPSACVVEILGVVSHRHAQFYSGGPRFTVEKFRLHYAPARFDDRIAIAITNAPWTKFKHVNPHALNTWPRKTLGWKIPAGVFGVPLI